MDKENGGGRMRVILFFLLGFISCSEVDTKPTEKKIDEWFILENAVKENWNKEKLERVLGKPDKILKFQNSQFDSYRYNELKSGYQRWIFDFNQDNVVIGISHSPTRMFMDELRKHWVNLKCIEKTKPSKISHIIKNQRYLSCEGGKLEAYYSKFDEVESILVSK